MGQKKSTIVPCECNDKLDIEQFKKNLILSHDDIVHIFDNMSCGIIITDTQLNVLYTNDKACDIFGYDKTDFFQETFSIKQLMNSCDSKNHDKYVQRYLYTKEKHILNKCGRIIECVHSSGRRFHASLMIFHRSNHFIAIFTDLTLQKQLSNVSLE